MLECLCGDCAHSDTPALVSSAADVGMLRKLHFILKVFSEAEEVRVQDTPCTSSS